MPPTTNNTDKISVFEKTTRTLRWAMIAVVLLTFPLHTPQTTWLYLLLAAELLYNLSRYVPFVQRSVVLRSPIGMVIADNLFVGALLVIAGGIATPYSGFLVFMIIITAYLYELRGVLVVVALQFAILSFALARPLLEPITLDNVRVVILTLFMLLAFGYLVDRLTSNDRRERRKLVDLQHQSEREQARLSTLVNSLNTAIFLTDKTGKIIHANEAARILAGAPKSLVDESFAKVVVLRSRTDPSRKPVDVFDQNSTAQHRRDLGISTEDGVVVDLDISVTPILHDASDKVAEYIIACEDITTERSLDEQRTEFISVASHELRTPLAILEAALEMALTPKNEFTPEVRKLLEQAHRNAMYLAGIIKDITVLAEARNDNLPIQLTEVSAADLLEGLSSDFTTQAEQKGMSIRSQTEPGTPVVLSTEQYIREILQNYMTNALKYSDKGTITLAASPAKNGGVLFSVHDEGIGISPKDQKLLFTKFFRAEDFRTRTTGGTGLGLYLCMEIAERMGAKLWCKSVPNEGSTFFLEVPPFSNLKRDGGDVVKAQVANLIDGF